MRRATTTMIHSLRSRCSFPSQAPASCRRSSRTRRVQRKAAASSNSQRHQARWRSGRARRPQWHKRSLGEVQVADPGYAGSGPCSGRRCHAQSRPTRSAAGAFAGAVPSAEAASLLAAPSGFYPVAATAPVAATGPGVLLHALRDELFVLETDRLAGRLSEAEYAAHKAAFDVVLRRAISRSQAPPVE